MFEATSKNKNFAYVTPVALVALTACQTKVQGVANTVNGAVVNGPLSNALVFLDLNDNKTLDPGEDSIRTEADGSFSINTTANIYKIVAITDESTVDTSSGAILAGKCVRSQGRDRDGLHVDDGRSRGGSGVREHRPGVDGARD